MSKRNGTYLGSVIHLPPIIRDILDASQNTESMAFVKREMNSNTSYMYEMHDKIIKAKPNHTRDFRISTHLTISGQ